MATLVMTPRKVVLHPSCPACGAGPSSYVSHIADDDVDCLMCGRSVVARVIVARPVVEPERPRRGRPPKNAPPDPKRTAEFETAIYNLLDLQPHGSMSAVALAEAVEVDATRREWLAALDRLLATRRVKMVFALDGTIRYVRVAQGAKSA